MTVEQKNDPMNGIENSLDTIFIYKNDINKYYLNNIMNNSTDTTVEEYIQSATAIIQEIYAKYAENKYMLNRAHSYICEQLPITLENIQKNHEQRQLRIEELTHEQDFFIQSFLTNNPYFYIPSTEKYFFYDGEHYQLCKEEDVMYNILSAISKDRSLLAWKQRTKVYIMKRIKENNLLKSVPESNTIQHILDLLHPTLFSTRAEAKYFLTILGDNIFKKNGDIVHFITVNAKHFIREINNLCQLIVGVNLGQSFRHKYHEHEYNNCRLVNINECVKHENVWDMILQNSIIDLICVACHYSIRYGNSDDYVLNSSNESSLIDKVFYLKNIQPEDLVNNFIDDFLQKNDSVVVRLSDASATTQITWKSMQYLWKNYLDSKNLPMIMFQNTLKQFLIQKMGDYYNEEADSFIGICSKYLPEIQKFVLFWDETIVYDELESDMEFEIDEICVLFKKWCVNKNETYNMNSKQILDLIAYYFPYAEIERDKYIYKIRSSMWDKQMDIQIALDNIKERYRNYSTNGERVCSPVLNISIYDAYVLYCKYYANDDIQSKYNIVSKSYFEKYIYENMGDYIIDNKFISTEWFIV